MFDKSVYISRREKLKQQLRQGLVLLLGNEDSSMNYKDNLYPFRQDSSFLYFYGMDRPGLAALIDIDHDQEIVFGNDLTLDDIVWTGPQPSLAQQAEPAGITDTRPSAALPIELVGARGAGRTIHFLPPYRPENILKLSAWLGFAPGAVRGHASVPLIKAVVEQRSVKSAEEVEQIEEAVDITAAMHLAAIRGARDGKRRRNWRVCCMALPSAPGAIFPSRPF